MGINRKPAETGVRMKVTIKDKDALMEIKKDDLEDYLLNNEWEPSEPLIRNEKEIGTVYKKYSEVLHRYFYVNAIEEDLADYTARMSENIMQIEQCEDVSQLQIYSDITNQIIIFEPTN
jgi:hypothetical protein